MYLWGMQLPPGQQLVAAGKWPLVGERQARPSNEPWTVRVCGLVDSPRSFSLAELGSLPRVERTIDIHCVTRWSKPAMRFGGVLLAELLSHARSQSAARFVSFVSRSARDHSTSLVLAEALSLDTLIALECEGQPLAAQHGGPVRVVVPRRYFYKSLKWLADVELLTEDRLGYWEETAGYHNHADPWREERYIAPGLSKQETAAVLASRDWSGRDLLSIDAGGRELRGLVAERALLRNADFRRCDLREASFREANLSNAHFQNADLRGANFSGADCEGADFSGADLREADFSGASLFGASFCSEADSTEPAAAQLDGATRIDLAAIEQLVPRQQEFVRRFL
jgi:DMSO/TMAO reductase YedYZ molybdopterin-dependent catalytic subunit